MCLQVDFNYCFFNLSARFITFEITLNTGMSVFSTFLTELVKVRIISTKVLFSLELMVRIWLVDIQLI